MKKLAVEHPIIFELVLIVVGFALALAFSIVGQIMYFSDEVSVAIGRILAGCLLLAVFHRCLDVRRQLSGVRLALPALLFVVWNIVLCFITGDGAQGFSGFMVLLALAPAVFEETIFRGIFIHNLKASGKQPLQALLISALLFGAMHLTNIAGMELVQVLVQVAYSVVVGLVFGAIYIKSGDLVSLMAVHFAIDLTSRVFPGGATTPIPLVVVFIALLVAEGAYAFFICRDAEFDAAGLE